MSRSTISFLLLIFVIGPLFAADGSLPEGAIARLGGELRLRHAQSVSDVLFSSDGKTLISAGYEGTIRSWDATSGRELLRLPAHRSFARLALSPDGKLVASCGGDAVVRLWDAVTGKERWTVKDRVGSVNGVSFSADGKTVASGGEDRTVRLVDVGTGAQRLKIGAHEDHVGDVAFSPDGKLLASCSAGLVAANQQPKKPDLSIRLWDPATGRRVATLEGHTRGIHRIAFSPDGKLLASASWQEGKVRLWEMPGGKPIRVLESKAEESRFQKGVRADFYSLAFSPDGKMLAAGGPKQSVSLWESATGKELPSLRGRGENASRSRIMALAFAPDGKTLAGGSEDSTIRLWDLATGKERFDAGEHADRTVHAAAFSPDGNSLAVGTDDQLTVWDWATGKDIRRWPGPTQRLAFSPDGKLLASAEMKGKVVLRDPTNGEDLERFQAPNPEYADVNLAFSPDGKRLATGYRDALLLYDVGARKELARARREKNGYRSLAFAPSGNLVATFGVLFPTHDARITLWDASRTADVLSIEVERLGGMWSYLVGGEFSSDGRTVTVVSMDRAIRQWELASGKEVRVIAAPEPNSRSTVVVRAAAFSPDRRLVALARDKDKSVRLWDVNAGKELKIIEPREGIVYAVAFSPDGKRLVTGHQGGSVLVWDVTEQAKATNAPPASDLAAAELDKLWAALAGDDATLAYKAASTLAGSTDRTAEALGERLTAAVPPTEGIRPLLLRLDHEFPAVRESAAKELSSLSPAVDPMLRKVLEGKPSANVRKALEVHLQSSERGLHLPAGDLLRTARAVAVLERMDIAAARKVLDNLAKGPSEGLATQEAKAALERVQARPKQQ